MHPEPVPTSIPLIRSDLQRLAALAEDHRPFELPYFWGAFICQGDPAPLG
jgi:hypothetical protein